VTSRISSCVNTISPERSILELISDIFEASPIFSSSLESVRLSQSRFQSRSGRMSNRSRRLITSMMFGITRFSRCDMQVLLHCLASSVLARSPVWVPTRIFMGMRIEAAKVCSGPAMKCSGLGRVTESVSAVMP